MYQNLKKLLILLEYPLIALYLLLVQVAYVMESEETIAREFSAFSPIKDASPKYVLILDTMLMYGKEASNRKQEIDRQHYTIPNQRPKDKHFEKI